MLILCRLSIVVVHLLLLSHIAHTFVLLTANVDDVKKIARKFVSDELADKIADFIARATETFAQQTPKASEEDIKDNSQVSAENRMYNVERHGFDRLPADAVKSKVENAGKVKVITSTEKKNPLETEDIITKFKPRKETKGKSRYIVEPDKQDSTTTEKAGSEEDNYKKMKDSIKFIENNLLGVTEKAKNKKPKQKKNKVKPYKLLSTFDTDETNAMKEVNTDSKDKKKKEAKRSQRAFDDEIAAIRKAALEYDNKDAVKISALVEESEKYGNEITKTEKVAKSGSLVIEKDGKEDKWWEKDLPKPNQDDANLKRKSWF